MILVLMMILTLLILTSVNSYYFSVVHLALVGRQDSAARGHVLGLP
jgi:hypothetical protein